MHRPRAVVGPNAPSEDALNALLRFSLMQNAVPSFKNFVGFLYFAPILEVAANIARSALQKDYGHSSREAIMNTALSGNTSLTIVHHSSGVKTGINEFRGRMEALHSRHFRELSFATWIEEAVKGGMDPLISTYLNAIVEKDSTIAFPYLGEPSVGARH